MKLFSIILTVFLLFFISSCGKDNKQSQSNLRNIDEDKQFALSLYGDEVKIIANGDLLGNGKLSAIAAIVMKQTDNSYLIRKGSFIQKELDGWKVLMKMEDRIYTSGGDMLSQVDAKNGYIISFDSSEKPISFNIVIANEYGKGASDEAVLIWNFNKQSFEFSAPNDNIIQ